MRLAFPTTLLFRRSEGRLDLCSYYCCWRQLLADLVTLPEWSKYRWCMEPEPDYEIGMFKMQVPSDIDTKEFFRRLVVKYGPVRPSIGEGI